MQFDLTQMKADRRYELLLSTVVPRPIALVTTQNADGAINAAPYSLFNIVSHDPAMLMLAVLPHAEARLKDTARNITETKEFVVNLVSEQLAEAMNISCIDAPPARNELELAKLPSTPSVAVKPPRIAMSPVSYECRLETTLSFGKNQMVIFGKILNAHVEDRFVIDAEQAMIDTPSLALIGAMHGAKWYSRMSDLFAMDRPTWDEWIRLGKVTHPTK